MSRQGEWGRIVEPEELRSLQSDLKREGKRLVFTNGCFDLLHVGHLRTLLTAAEQGDILVVGLNSDDSVRRLKGEGRPLVAERERAAMLAALRCVDYVVIFDEETPLKVIEALRPDVLVKGGDYDPKATSGPAHIVGSELVRSYGGEVVVIDLVDGRSTSGLVRKLQTPPVENPVRANDEDQPR